MESREGADPAPGSERTGISPAPRVSVILPTYNERASLEQFDPELQQVLLPLAAEIVVVDDASPDGTAEWARRATGPVAHRVLERKGVRGLASAVWEGIRAARGSVVVVMDADGSHDPSAIPEMVEPILAGRAEFVLGSRWGRGGTAGGLAGSRRVISRGAQLLARPVVRAGDPMSGFFAVRRDVALRVPLAPRGFKIGLEILVRSRPDPVLEVPIRFRPRIAGESKLGGREMREYLWQLAGLYRARVTEGRTASRTR